MKRMSNILYSLYISQLVSVCVNRPVWTSQLGVFTIHILCMCGLLMSSLACFIGEGMFYWLHLMLDLSDTFHVSTCVVTVKSFGQFSCRSAQPGYYSYTFLHEFPVFYLPRQTQNKIGCMIPFSFCFLNCVKFVKSGQQKVCGCSNAWTSTHFLVSFLFFHFLFKPGQMANLFFIFIFWFWFCFDRSQQLLLQMNSFHV